VPKPLVIRLLLSICAALLLAAPAPALAQAEIRTFVSTDDLFPAGNGVFGPATIYPSTIAVSAVKGTVTNVSVTLIDVEAGSPDDMDIGIRGPGGQTVMLVSDACGESTSIADDDWTFDDSAPTFLSDNGPCPSNEAATFKPSNYFGNNPEPDDLSPGGGPTGPYLNELGFLEGGSPEGEWDLFARDDNPTVVGLFLAAWVLTLEVEPPPAALAPAAPIVVIAPAQAGSPPPVAKTGRRAAALGKCKAKKSSKARRICRRKAQKLPL
jgi:hypothetical protein